MAGAEGLEVAPQKHSRIACLERFALLLVSSPHRRAFLRRRRRRNGSPRHAVLETAFLSLFINIFADFGGISGAHIA